MEEKYEQQATKENKIWLEMGQSGKDRRKLFQFESTNLFYVLLKEIKRKYIYNFCLSTVCVEICHSTNANVHIPFAVFNAFSFFITIIILLLQFPHN